MAAVVFGLASAVFGRRRGAGAPAVRCHPAPALPVGDVAGDDVRALRFQQAVRGYRMSEVDWVARPARRRAGPRAAERDDLQTRVAALEARTPAERLVVTDRVRCAWAGSAPEYVAYHDDEWGRPLHGVGAAVRAAQPGGVPVGAVLAGDPAQAAGVPGGVRGLRPGRRRRLRPRTTWHGCSPTRASSATAPRSRRPCHNAGRVIELDAPLGRAAVVVRAGPASTSAPGDARRRARDLAESMAMAKELKRRGFRFVGPTTCYALMQAAGLVDDHVADCWRATPAA